MIEENLGYHNFRIELPNGFEEVFTHFYFAENRSGEAITKTLLPSYQTILVFSFGEKPYLVSKHGTRLEVNKYLLLGPIKQAFEYTLPANTEILIVNFKDDAFYRIFGKVGVSEHLPIGPEDLVHGDYLGMLWYELSKMEDTHTRVNYVLKFSEPYLTNRNKIAAQLASVREQPLNPIKSVAYQNNQSERNMQLQHKKHFGYSAKEHIRYLRFLKAVVSIQSMASSTSKIDWLQIVADCGYYDQSQLIKDFKHYINLSPTQYLNFQQEICNPIS
ncbi:helix-turn-helix domain-containing protein [Anditalea andensis]|uniref:DNA-binding protein n=1 Tax=Anditalea andensis TaxID=1048983 RepID=A0A074L0B4_9BACT|nr:helix-turn-helix domain-containing protein [Anditalea andensis]KEO73930.1 DNA-binding protein [Anditalea andensis]